MTNQEISRQLYSDLSAGYNNYLNLEQQYQSERDEFKRQDICKKLYQAREIWLKTVGQFRNHLSYLREKNNVVEMEQSEWQTLRHKHTG